MDKDSSNIDALDDDLEEFDLVGASLRPVSEDDAAGDEGEEAAAVGSGAGAGSVDGDDAGLELADETVEERPLDDEDGDGDVPATAREPAGPDNASFVFTGHADSVYCVAVSPDGRLAASGDGADVALLWRVDGTAPAIECRGHGDTVVAAAFSYNGALLATASLDATARVWDAASGSLVAVCEGLGADVNWLAWHPKGDVLLAGSNDCTSWMWHIRPGKEPAATCMAVFAGHVDAVTCGGFTPDGKHVVTGCADGSVRVWQPKTSACTTTLAGRTGHEDAVNALACAPDRPLVLTGSQDGTARLSNMATGKTLTVFRHGRMASAAPVELDAGAAAVERPGRDAEDEAGHPSVESVAFCDVGPLIASGATDGSLVVWDTGSMAARHRITLGDAVIKVAWLPGKHTLAASTADGAVVLFDGRDGKQLARYTGHRGAIFDFAVSSAPGARALVTAGDDHTCRVYALD